MRLANVITATENKFINSSPYAQAHFRSAGSNDNSPAWSSASHFLLTQHANSSIKGLLLQMQLTSESEQPPKLPMQVWEQAGRPTICDPALMANSAAKKAMWNLIVKVVFRPRWLEASSHAFAAELNQVGKLQTRGGRNIIMKSSTDLMSCHRRTLLACDLSCVSIIACGESLTSQHVSIAPWHSRGILPPKHQAESTVGQIVRCLGANGIARAIVVNGTFSGVCCRKLGFDRLVGQNAAADRSQAASLKSRGASS